MTRSFVFCSLCSRNIIKRSLQALCVMVAAIGLSGCEEPLSEKENVRPVKAVMIGQADRLAQRWFTGKAKATKEVDVSFRVAGLVTALPFNIGDDVKKGEVAAQLDQATYQADMKQAAAELSRAKAEKRNADLELSRTKTLFKQGHVSKARLDNTLASARVSQADVSSAGAILDRRKLDLGYTSLRAPFDGIVVAQYVERFEEVQAKQSVLRIVNAEQIEMIVDIPESLISAAPKIKSALVKFDAFPDVELIAKIKEIGREASDTARTYPITLIMEQPEGLKILPGMAGRATAHEIEGDLPDLEQGQDIPIGAAFSSGEDDATYVWVVDASTKTVSKRKVTVEKVGDFGLQVKSGVSAGEWIVTAGVYSLRDGQTVRLLD